jgi:hypothetical protein
MGKATHVERWREAVELAREYLDALLKFQTHLEMLPPSRTYTSEHVYADYAAQDELVQAK